MGDSPRDDGESTVVAGVEASTLPSRDEDTPAGVEHADSVGAEGREHDSPGAAEETEGVMEGDGAPGPLAEHADTSSAAEGPGADAPEAAADTQGVMEGDGETGVEDTPPGANHASGDPPATAVSGAGAAAEGSTADSGAPEPAAQTEMQGAGPASPTSFQRALSAAPRQAALSKENSQTSFGGGDRKTPSRAPSRVASRGDLVSLVGTGSRSSAAPRVQEEVIVAPMPSAQEIVAHNMRVEEGFGSLPPTPPAAPASSHAQAPTSPRRNLDLNTSFPVQRSSSSIAPPVGSAPSQGSHSRGPSRGPMGSSHSRHLPDGDSSNKLHVDLSLAAAKLGSHIPPGMMADLKGADVAPPGTVPPPGLMPPPGMMRQPSGGMMPPPGMLPSHEMSALMRPRQRPLPQAPAGAAPFMERTSKPAGEGEPGVPGPSGLAYGGPGDKLGSAGPGLNKRATAGMQGGYNPTQQGPNAGGSQSTPSSGRKPGSPQATSSTGTSTLIGLSWAQQEVRLQEEQARRVDMFKGLFRVQGVRDRASREQPTHIAPKPRRIIPGRINFVQLGVPPANTGGGTLPPEQIKAGLERRKAAALYMTYGVYKSEEASQQVDSARAPTPEGAKLDGFMLLEAGDDEFPEGVTAAKLAHRNICYVESADLAYFSRLKVVDFSDNRLPDMISLAALPVVRHCSLASNRLKTLGDFDPTEYFQNLEVLDLSYNYLSAEELLGEQGPLAHLPRLQELDVSGNGLKALPEDVGPFESLKILKLNENELRGAALAALAGLPSLSVLSMARNKVSTAPKDGSLSPPAAFQQLRILDLTHNRISDKESLAPLRGLPCLQKLLLEGNPLAVQAVAKVKKVQERKSLLEEAAHTGTALNPADVANDMVVEQYDGDDLMQYKKPEKQKVSIVASLAHGRMVTIDPAMNHRSAERNAAAAAVAAVSDEALEDAFDRIDGAIDLWALNTVEEGEEEEEDEGVVEDNTFLTGVGISEKAAQEAPEAEEVQAEPAVKDGGWLWEDVEDPTERLALALGLDPLRLAIHTGRLTTDSVGSISALRFALSHPLVQADEGMAPAKHHLATTQAARLKQRKKLAPLVHMPRLQAVRKIGEEPLQASAATAAAAKADTLPRDGHVVRVQTIEGMLSGMRDRLKSLETSLARKLADAPPPSLPAQQPGGAKAAKSLSALDTERASGDGQDVQQDPEVKAEEEDADEDADEDARSDMSPLPEDVIDAIENPDLSDSDGGEEVYNSDEEEKDGLDAGELEATDGTAQPQPQQRGGPTSGVGPAAALAASTVPSTLHAGHPSARGASAALGYS